MQAVNYSHARNHLKSLIEDVDQNTKTLKSISSSPKTTPRRC
ncbi:hypothetical protein [Hydrogenimonas cancrithermarum]|nr:hypothetical protein [Hydrogenimonas cancrithermarum]